MRRARPTEKLLLYRQETSGGENLWVFIIGKKKEEENEGTR